MHMVSMDMTAQWLAGDELKQDQFKFIYETMKIVYDSALREFLLAEDPIVLEVVVPELVAYCAIKVIQSILNTKLMEKKKE